MAPGLLFHLCASELRGARTRSAFLALFTALGVTSVVAVATWIDAIDAGLRRHSRALLGGDIALESRARIPDPMPYVPSVWQLSARRAEIWIASSLVRSDAGRSKLVELKAVRTQGAPYPLAGALEVAPASARSALDGDDALLVAPELARELALEIGDRLLVGQTPLRVAGTILREPDPLDMSLSFGPRVLLSQRALLRSGLIAPGSRIRYRSVISVPGASERELADIQTALRESLAAAQAAISIETHSEAQPVLAAPLARVQRYLNLVAFLSLLLACLGVAQSVSAWLAQTAQGTAVLRALGLAPREVLLLRVSQLALLALTGSLLGAGLGVTLPRVCYWLRPDFLPITLSFTAPSRPFISGVALGLSLPLAFSAPALLMMLRVSPARVLRSEAVPLRTPAVLRTGASSIAIAGAYAGALAQSGDALVALVFVLGTSLLALTLLIASRGLARLARIVPRGQLPAFAWHGIARFVRPSAGVAGSVVALGLGTSVVVGLALLQRLMSEELDHLLPPDAPSVFLLDVQPEQWPDVRTTFERAGARRIDHTQLYSARLSHVANRPVRELVAERGENPNARSAAHWVLTREQRVAAMSSLPKDNRIVAGQLWSEPGVNELSLEVAFARALGAQLGTWLRLDFQGVAIDFKVTSLRTVNFRSFALNFYMLAEPSALAGAPHVVLAGVRLPGHQEQRVQDKLARLHPNVTMVRVAGMIERTSTMLGQAAFAVQLVGSFAILTGLVILASAISARQRERARELALLRALGVDRATIIALLAGEYAVLGAVAGTLGAVVGYLLTIFLATRLLELSAPPSWLVCCSGVLCVVATSVLTGLAASARALRSRPRDVLRAPS